MIDLTQYWWPLAISGELSGKKPLARTLHGVPLVLFRDNTGKPGIIEDRCPHRHAPFSSGRVCRGEIECPYHGWRFDRDGRCTRIPGILDNGSSYDCRVLHPIPVCEVHGMIWGALSISASTPEPVAPSVAGDNLDTFFITDSVTCTIPAAAENFLDGFHTHFVHAGWIRHDTKRQSVRAQVRRLPNGVEVLYSEEGLQSGFISRFLEKDRVESLGRFRMPGVAEIEYLGGKGLNLLITAWLTPETSDRLRIHARIATRRGMIPGPVKAIFLKRLFGIILRQDKDILERTHNNITKFTGSTQPRHEAGFVNSPLDLLGPSIRSLVNGEMLEDIDTDIMVKL